MKNSVSFYVSIVVSMALLFVIAYFIPVIAKKELPQIIWWLIPVYSVLSIFLYHMIAKNVKNRPARFVTAVYSSVLIKLFLSILIVGAYFYLQLPGKKAFAIAVMGIYSINTVVLIRSILPLLRTDSPVTSAS